LERRSEQEYGINRSVADGGHGGRPSMRNISQVLLALLVLCAAPGCAWLQKLTSTNSSPLVTTRAIPENATLSEVIATVNRTPGLITSMKTTNATVSGRAGLLPIPSLSANIALERPQRFRLVGELGTLGGQEVDLGSNEELFWFWVKRNQPPAIFYSRHEEFAQSAARQAWPIDPMWLMDAFGLAMLDPDGQHSGPQPVGKGRLEVRTVFPSGAEQWTKVSRIDSYLGQIVEQHVYNGNTLVASVLMRDHRPDATYGLMVPRVLELKWPSTNLSLKVNLGDVTVNSTEEQNAALWTMPTISGFRPVNLLDVQPQFGQEAGGAAGPQNVTTWDRRGVQEPARAATRERVPLWNWLK
jgi:hypothetical protein